MSAAGFTVPGLVARLGRRLPAPLVSLHFVAGLELARRLNWLSPPAELDGRSFAITIEDLGVRSSFMAVSYTHLQRLGVGGRIGHGHQERLAGGLAGRLGRGLPRAARPTRSSVVLSLSPAPARGR